MANVRAFRSGNWSDTNPATSPWGTGGALYAPAANDDVFSNTFIIHVDTSVAANSVTNGSTTLKLWKDGATTTATAGGTFNLLNGVTLTGNININVGQTPTTSSASAVLSGTNAATIVGIVYGNTAAGGGSIQTVINSGSNVLTIVGGLQAQDTSYVVSVASNTSSGVINITGNIIGGPSSRGLDNTSAGTIIVTGNVTGGTGSAAYGINNSSTGSVTVVGNVLSDSRGGAGITSTNAAANVRISGNLIGAPNGIPAVYAASYTVNPVPYQTYIRYANNGTGVGSDAYLYHYTTDSLSAFSMPPVSAVRAGLQYANNTLTGTCQMPAASAVTFGALVGNTTGTAALTSNTLFDVSVASLTASDSLGARLKNSATVESVGRIIASFSNG